MAEQKVAGNSATSDALMVNAGVSMSTLSSSSSCISSSSPTSSFGSTGNGGCVLSSEKQQISLPHQMDKNLKRVENDGDDSGNNVNTVSTTTTTSAVNHCNLSGERGGSCDGGDHRGSAEDIISHLNMLSMHDGLGFNGFGLLGTGIGSGANAWTPPTNNIPSGGNGLNKQTPNFGPVQDHQQMGVANYIEALKLQQHFQFQQLKPDVISNFFSASTPSTNNAPNFFGGSAPAMQQQQNHQHFRRPIFGAAGTGGTENNMYPAPYGNFFMTRSNAAAVHFPPPLEFGNHGRGKPFSPNNSFAIVNNDNGVRNYSQQRTNIASFNQQQPPPPPPSGQPFYNIRHQMNGGAFFPTTPAPPTFGNRNALFMNGTNGGGPRLEQYKPTMPYQQQQQQQKGAPFLSPPFLQQQQNNQRRGGGGSCNTGLQFNGNIQSTTTSSMFGAIGAGPFRSSASDISSLSSSGAGNSQRFSRKVFVGGLPPDIDEAINKRPSSAMKYSESSMLPSVNNNPSNMLMLPSNFSVAGMMPNSTSTRSPAFLRFAAGAGSAGNAQELFSRKVFVGGLPMDISEDEICSTFTRFGTVIVDWPHKAESKSYFPPKGYAFLIFHNENSVQLLIETCIYQDGRYYMCVSSPTMREKAVQIRPWRLTDADFVLDPALALDPRKTVFVGGVPRPLKAVELASILERLFGGVCYTGIDTDPELKYPKGAGRVSFSNQQSYIAAISARFVQLQHGDIDKRVEIKPYVLDDQMCDECGGARCGGKYAPYFCANVGCLQYYCDLCWQHIHSKAGREFHKPLVKEGSDRPRAVPFKWGM